MTIRKRNRIIVELANRISSLEGAIATHWHEVDTEDHSSLCCDFVCERAARDTYNHMANRRVYHTLTGGVRLARGVAELRGMLAETLAEYRDIARIDREDAAHSEAPPPGWQDRAVDRARAEGVLS